MKIVTINAMWCPGCIVMHKVWNNIKNKYSDIEFENYDYDIDEEIVKSFSPGDVLPITIFFKDDKEVDRLTGEKSENELINIIEKYR